MGASRRIWRTPGVRGRRRAGAVAGFAVVAVAGVVACEPGGLNTGAVAFTTDQAVTRELQRQKTDVRWLTCTASYGEGGGGTASSTATEKAVADVDCEGETGDGRDITVTGRITRVVNGACVRGSLTAKVDGKVWFRVDGLGNCDAATSAPPAGGEPGGEPGGGGAEPTVTVTVTRTVWCREDPDCAPVEGK
ncbi:hypothetical protein [Streptomyces sp. DH24]|uniref:hypothetical protein n=1 Tax=Streptomyces sp. DH24 TaxID=3040123 RepID=UPI002441B89B|nr:hypothetical protein [Streptomyces sp. DH24]MDG9719178.1 hypothetical protein [Streptomyces sp. DH24]